MARNEKAAGAADRLSWRVRIGFGTGDMAQNLAYSAVGTYLLFFCTDVIGLAPAAVATMFFVVQCADVLWNPFTGVFIDRHNPSWGKYRSYLVLAGLPLAAFAVLCFANPVGGFGGVWKLVYVSVAYAGFTLFFTLVNVAYGALSASLSRDLNEITVLTSTRIFMANAGSLAAMVGVPMFAAALADGGQAGRVPLSEAGSAVAWGYAALPWRMALFMGFGMLPSFVFMPLLPVFRRFFGKKRLFFVFASVAICGMAALYLLSRFGRIEDIIGWIYVAQFVKAAGIIVATGYMWALVPEVIAYSEHLTGRRISGVVNAIMGIFFRMGLAFGKVVSGLVLAGTGYCAAAMEGTDDLPTDSRVWFWTMAGFAAVSAAMFMFSFAQTKERIVMDVSASAQVKVGELWREFRRNAPMRILALFFVTAYAMMSVGNVAGTYFMNGLDAQSPLAQEGIRWLVCVIPAMLLAVAAFAIARYPLDDSAVDRLNRTLRHT